jgi:hypothetical protein
VTQRNWLTTALAARIVQRLNIAPTAQIGHGYWFARCDVNFDTQAEADLFFAELQTRWAGTAQIIAGSWAQKHLCSHDDPVVLDCQSDPASAFVRVVK